MKWRKNLHLAEDGNGVCSKLILKEWGEQGPSYAVDSYTGMKEDHATDLSELKAHLRFCVEQWDKQWDAYKGSYYLLSQNKSVHRVAVIEATTCSLQPMANKYLKELGFKKFGGCKKLKHPETKLYVWLIRADKFLEAIKE